jgi:hypothetical protein
MAEILTGVLSVSDSAILQTPQGDFEVIAYPLQMGVGWDSVVSRSLEALRPYHGQQVNLRCERHGQLLSSAEVLRASEMRNGTYSGRLESTSGGVLHVQIRIDRADRVLSADFFRAGAYFCSLRSRFTESATRLIATSPRVIFDTQDDSFVGGSLEIESSSGSSLRVQCVLPMALPEIYQGEATFDSPHFRTINVEVDKLDGMPWPPEFASIDIPTGEQPAALSLSSISLASIFERGGIEARLHFSDGALAADLGASTGRPWEEDRWDERELHEMMDRNYSRSLDDREWWLYLLIVTRFDGGPQVRTDGTFPPDEQGRPLNDGVGTTGIIFDSAVGDIRDPWSSFFRWFEQNRPQFKHLFDFGREGNFRNSRARQGVAVFWREMLDFAPEEPWARKRMFLRTIMHELGHALNLAHTWLVNRPASFSFMNYPHRHPSGETNYWRTFQYQFDPEELFHCRHGFLNEVIPGGRNEFMRWSSSSVFVDPGAGGTRSNLTLEVVPTKETFKFTEPVTINIRVRNHSAEDLPIGKLSPSYGHVDFVIRKPNGTVQRYSPPIYKCEIERERLASQQTRSHLTSLAVDAHGFTFETPGRYEITASLPDPSSGYLVVAKPVSIWIGYPDAAEEDIANHVFDRQTALFLYMAGGEHLRHAKSTLEEITGRYPDHPFSAHANLVLGLNELWGQKSTVRGEVKKADPKAAEPYILKAEQSGVFSKPSVSRMRATLDLCMREETPPKKGRGDRKS